MKIELNPYRTSLAEGRSCGIGFGFLKKVNEDFFKGVVPVSPCKDYCNDVVWSETTGRKLSVYGCNTEKFGCFDTHAHMAVQVCGDKYGYKHSRFDIETKALIDNLDKTKALLNKIEEMLGVKERTEVAKVEDNLVYAKIPLEWVSSTWATSMWAFLFRNFIYAADEDPFKALEKSQDTNDRLNYKTVIKMIEKFKTDGFPKQNMDAISGYSVHGAGIISYSQSYS